MKTLRLNLFLATFLTVLSLFVVFIPYSIFLGWNLFTALFFWFILLPIAANRSASFFRSSGHLLSAILGVLLFYAFMIFMIYEHYNSDLFQVMFYSLPVSLFLLLLYNYRQIPFFSRK
jgi:hypothetical protein